MGYETMKIAAYDKDGETMMGIVDPNGEVRPICDQTTFWNDPAAALAGAASQSVGLLSSLDERPAVPPTAKVICVGLNYRKHAIETGSPIPETPVIFSRWASTLSTDGVPAPRVDDKFDWEVELGAVIGRRMFRANVEEARSGVFGYATFNDISARSFQIMTSQWTLGKNSDASGPMSPIVTADEVGDPAEGLRITTLVNGKMVQDSTTSDMIFTVPEVIQHLTQVMTLEPGDFIVTGTPSGVGMATGDYLQVGDVVEVEIEKIGKVRTPISAPPAAAA